MTMLKMASSLDARAAELVEKLIDKLQAGDHDAESFIAAHPEHEAALRRLLPALRMMADLSERGISVSAVRPMESGEPPDRTGETPILPGILGDFRILREVGRGGMGVVYEAEQISLRRRVALKVLPFAAALDPRQLQRFKNEALAAASLHHEHIIPVYAVGCERAVHFYAMQFIEGCTLADVIRELADTNPKREPGHHRQAGDRGQGTSDREGEAPAEPLRLRTGGNRGNREIQLTKGNEGNEEQQQNADPSFPSLPSVQTAASKLPPLPLLTPVHTPVHAVQSPGGGSNETKPIASLLTNGSWARGREFIRRAAELIADAADALEHAHSLGIVHRDIKPGNLLLDSGGKILIGDFGLARFGADGGLTMTGDIVGTLRYMAPEQALAKHGLVDHRADIYALGATLYELLTFRPVVDATERAEILRRIAFEEPVPLRTLDRSIPLELDTIALKCLAKSPGERYAAAGDLADDLRRVLADRPIKARPPTLVQRAAKWSRLHAPLLILAAASLLALTLTLAITAGLLWRERGQTQLALKSAEASFQTAIVQQRQAESFAEEVRVRLYAADMRLAFQAWNSADLKQTIELLTRYSPSANQPDLRGFEWHYLWRLCHDERLILTGHQGEVYWVAFSPDGKRIVTAGEDRTARVWDTASGQQLFSLVGHTGPVRAAMHSPAGNKILTASDDQTLKLWDAATGQIVRTIAGHTGELRCAAFAPDGKVLASGGLDDTMQLWDAVTGDVLAVFRGHQRGVRGVAFSPDGKTLATAAGDFLVKLWDLDSRQEAATLSGHHTWASGVAYSPDGQTLASSCWGPMIKVWDVATRRERYEVNHTNWVQSIAFSRDSQTLLSASRDTTVRQWDVATGRQVHLLRAHPVIVWCAAYSPDGQTIATAGADGLVKLWDVRAQAASFRLPIQLPTKRDPVGGGPLLTASLSQNGLRVAYFATHDRALRILHLNTGTTEMTSFGDQNDRAFKCMEIAPDGQSVATGSQDGLVQLWDLASGAELLRLDGGQKAYPVFTHSVTFSPDGKLLAAGEMTFSGENLGAVRLWDVATGNPVFVFRSRGAGARDVAFSPDGRLLAIADEDEVKVWRIADRQLHCVLVGHALGIGAVRFSPDGSLIATGSDDCTVRLWDTSTGTLKQTMLGHTNNVGSLAFSPDGRTLVSSGSDGAMRWWHVATGQELAVFQKDQQVLGTPAFCLGGQALATLGPEELLLWPAINPRAAQIVGEAAP